MAVQHSYTQLSILRNILSLCVTIMSDCATLMKSRLNCCKNHFNSSAVVLISVVWSVDKFYRAINAPKHRIIRSVAPVVHILVPLTC